MKKIAQRIEGFETSIFATMSKLAIQHQAINLSQGFPDFDCPLWLKELVNKAINEGHNQYAPYPGLQILREKLASVYTENYSLEYHPESEITVTVGATEGIFISILALVNPGDEVIIFEPFYDSYLAAIKLCGGIPVPVTLKAPEFTLDEHLEEAFSKNTKLVIFNNPHNPTGRVFSSEEISRLQKLVLKYDTYLLSDEVYEYMTYDGLTHLPSATFEGLKERTLTISSMGKTFGTTGWKIGWICAPPELTTAIRMVHQYNTFSVATPFQMAFAWALDRLNPYLVDFRKLYQEKRDYFYQELKVNNFRPVFPQGSYFIVCPIDHLTKENAHNFCVELIKDRQVAAIPTSAFYLSSKEGENYIRFCFAKKEETLRAASLKLQ